MSIVDILSKNEKKRRDALNEILNKVSEGTLATTAPFRKGANILAQNYASAFTGKDMSKSENQGAFLKYLAGAITPEEQKQISEKPLLEAVKSSAGMTSTLMPFAKTGVISNIGSRTINPTIKKLAQLATRGGTEGAVGGLGYSRKGKELEDTLTGVAIGIGGEVATNIMKNPEFRKGMTQEIKKANSGKYPANFDFARLVDEDLVEGNRGEKYLRVGNQERPFRKVAGGLEGKMTYSKQSKLAERSKTAKRIPISSWNADILEELKSKRK